MPPTENPSELRPLLHQKLEECAPEDLPLLHRVMLELERERLLGEVNGAFDDDRANGRMARLPEIIREARQALHGRR